ncbi:MAG: glycosyltransferase family 4 protein [candidate division KSB1 bacterium]|nr:glycosyltransferase family 4 protein [candidate division KSB1 bacterium]
MSNSVELELYGCMHDHSGYAVHTRAVARSLINAGFRVRLVCYNNTKPLPFPDLEPYRKIKLKPRYPIIRLIMLPPHPVYQQRRYTILYTMIETQSMHPGVIQRCSTADEVWTPNPDNVVQFRKHLHNSMPVYHMPEGTDPVLYSSSGPVAFDRDAYDFIACSVFAWQWRKGPDILLRAWMKAFTPKDKVRLLIRSSVVAVNKSTGRRIIREAVESAKTDTGVKDFAPIQIIEDPIPDEDIPKLYRSCDCFVLPTRGEGWCLPALDAMACGCVPVVTKTGGLQSFCTSSNSVQIKPGKPVVFKPDEFRLMNFFDDQTFHNPSPDDLAAALKKLKSNSERLKKLSNQGSEYARSHFSWNRSNQPIINRILEIHKNIHPKAKNNKSEESCTKSQSI